MNTCNIKHVLADFFFTYEKTLWHISVWKKIIFTSESLPAHPVSVTQNSFALLNPVIRVYWELINVLFYMKIQKQTKPFQTKSLLIFI